MAVLQAPLSQLRLLLPHNSSPNTQSRQGIIINIVCLISVLILIIKEKKQTKELNNSDLSVSSLEPE